MARAVARGSARFYAAIELSIFTIDLTTGSTSGTENPETPGIQRKRRERHFLQSVRGRCDLRKAGRRIHQSQKRLIGEIDRHQKLFAAPTNELVVLAQCRRENSTVETTQGYDMQSHVVVDEAKATACMSARGWQKTGA